MVRMAALGSVASAAAHSWAGGVHPLPAAGHPAVAVKPEGLREQRRRISAPRETDPAGQREDRAESSRGTSANHSRFIVLRSAQDILQSGDLQGFRAKKSPLKFPADDVPKSTWRGRPAALSAGQAVEAATSRPAGGSVGWGGGAPACFEPRAFELPPQLVEIVGVPTGGFRQPRQRETRPIPE
jgi:hypothetical protein